MIFAEKTKTCTTCHTVKPLDEFYKQKKGKYGKTSVCKECRKEYQKENKEHIKKQSKEYYEYGGGREKQGWKSMYKNKSSPQFIGIVVAERLIKHLFNDFEMMPPNFPGYDAVCNKGKKINIKASTAHMQQNKNSVTNTWLFAVRKNKVPDFFLCMSFDNVIDLNPLFAWLIPGSEVNTQTGIRISSSTIHKWDKWKMDLNNAQSCCDLMKKKS